VTNLANIRNLLAVRLFFEVSYLHAYADWFNRVGFATLRHHFQSCTAAVILIERVERVGASVFVLPYLPELY